MGTTTTPNLGLIKPDGDEPKKNWPAQWENAADKLDDELIPRFKVLTTSLSLTSTTLVDSEIAIPIDSPTHIQLFARWESGGGGIKWAWGISGTVDGHRAWLGPGRSGAGGVTDIETMQFRSTSSLTSDSSEISHLSTASTFSFMEDVLVDGNGTLTLRVAKKDVHTENSFLRSAGTRAIITKVLPL